MTGISIGYARCSTDEQDLEADRQVLLELGVPADQIYLDRAYSGATRERPGLDRARAAVSAGDTLVAPKLDRLARSVPDARAIGDSLAARGIRLRLGTMIYDRRTCSNGTPPASTPSPNSPDLFEVSRPTVYRVLERAGITTATADAA